MMQLITIKRCTKRYTNNPHKRPIIKISCKIIVALYLFKSSMNLRIKVAGLNLNFATAFAQDNGLSSITVNGNLKTV